MKRNYRYTFFVAALSLFGYIGYVQAQEDMTKCFQRCLAEQKECLTQICRSGPNKGTQKDVDCILKCGNKYKECTQQCMPDSSSMSNPVNS